MELADVPIWQWVAAIWTATWATVVYRTWTRVEWLLEATYPRHPMRQRPLLHMFVYIICINVVLPVVGIPITLFDESRDKWVYSYVDALGKNDKHKKNK